MSWTSKYAGMALVAGFSITACTKQSQPALPPPSHTGKDIVACYVGPYTFSTQGLLQFGGFFNNGIIYYLDADSTLGIKAIDWDDHSIIIGGKFNGVGTYAVDSGYPTPNGKMFAYYDTGLNSYHAYQGAITVSYYDGNIIAGTFFFSASEGAKVVRATNGEFDIASH
jgi:hypothetical protein